MDDAEWREAMARQIESLERLIEAHRELSRLAEENTRALERVIAAWDRANKSKGA